MEMNTENKGSNENFLLKEILPRRSSFDWSYDLLHCNYDTCNKICEDLSNTDKQNISK